MAVCDAVLMALEGEGRSPLPRSLSDSASARLTQNLAGSQRGREGLAVYCPIEFRANLRRRAKPGVDLLSAIRIRLLNRAGPTKAPCIMATSSPDGVRNPRRILNYLGQNTHRHRPFGRCAYSLLKRPKSHYLHPPGRAVSYLYTGSIALQVMTRWCQNFSM